MEDLCRLFLVENAGIAQARAVQHESVTSPRLANQGATNLYLAHNPVHMRRGKGRIGDCHVTRLANQEAGGPPLHSMRGRMVVREFIMQLDNNSFSLLMARLGINVF